MAGEHLVFYDGACGLCDHAVQFLLKTDHQQKFMFAPLQGETAKTILKQLPAHYKKEDSLVLVENYQTKNPQFFVLGKGALRICWLLGKGWTILGLLSFLPGFFYDWMYRIIARNRKFFFHNERCILPSMTQKERFLP